MKAYFDEAIAPELAQLKALLVRHIPVREEFDMTEEGPETEYHIVVRIDKDWKIEDLIKVRPF